MGRLALILIIICLAFTGNLVAQDDSSKLDLTTFGIESFSLLDVRNNKRSQLPVRSSAKRVFVLVFLSPECPLSQQYSLQLNQLAASNESEISMVGIFPGNSYDRKTILAFLKKYNIKFPAYIDGKKKLTAYLEASVTPEVIVFSKKEKDKLTIPYRGAIDDRVVDLGIKKIKASNSYLKDAIEQTLQNQDIVIKRTRPVGCLINDY